MGTSSAELFVYTVNLHCIVLELTAVVIFSSSYKENKSFPPPNLHRFIIHINYHNIFLTHFKLRSDMAFLQGVQQDMEQK